MPVPDADQVRAAEIVLPCSRLDETLAFFTDRLGFRVDTIFPADAPSVAVISGHGVRIRLQPEGAGAPGVLRLLCDSPPAAGDAGELIAPNGTRVQLVDADPPLVPPPAQPSFVLTRRRAHASWGIGRAGMRYRDLIAGRQGGRFIASHIRIPAGGPVADVVHFHRIRFQTIYCYKGWVRVAYEDQGAPIVLNEGDCVLQPPGIRHRVLECAPGLEVIEISCPAEHETHVDHDLVLPTSELRAERDFGGQRFVRHVAAAARWQPWRLEGFECRDTGIAAATDGLASVRVVRPSGAPSDQACSHNAEFLFLLCLHGTVVLHHESSHEKLAAGDCFVMPPTVRHALADCSDDLELLEVVLPAAVETIRHAGVDEDSPSRKR